MTRCMAVRASRLSIPNICRNSGLFFFSGNKGRPREWRFSRFFFPKSANIGYTHGRWLDLAYARLLGDGADFGDVGERVRELLGRGLENGRLRGHGEAEIRVRFVAHGSATRRRFLSKRFSGDTRSALRKRLAFLINPRNKSPESSSLAHRAEKVGEELSQRSHDRRVVRYFHRRVHRGLCFCGAGYILFRASLRCKRRRFWTLRANVKGGRHGFYKRERGCTTGHDDWLRGFRYLFVSFRYSPPLPLCPRALALALLAHRTTPHTQQHKSSALLGSGSTFLDIFRAIR